MKYSRTWSIGQWEHQWEIVGARGGVHLSIRPWKHKDVTEYSAGLECHFRTPPEYREDEAPSHVRCWLLEGPCWHDGTSTYAQEHFVPLFLQDDHDRIFHEMKAWADGQFNRDDTDA